jgi:predicted DsbA family dithiol-disulfide isomerase
VRPRAGLPWETIVDVTATIEIWSDIACAWATLSVWRLHQARARAGLVEQVLFDHHAFPLELINGRPTPRPVLDAEIPVVGALEPEFGWSVWRGAADSYPVSSLLALEAVQVAKQQGLEASAQLDLELRHRLFTASHCITMWNEVMSAARACPGLDPDALAGALRAGAGRAELARDWDRALANAQGSPQIVLPDGFSVHNPGITRRWIRSAGFGFPVVDGDDASVYADLIGRAAAAATH